jgi:hypothetical protein
MRLSRTFKYRALGAFAGLSLPVAALAGPSADFLTITATNASGSSTTTIPTSSASYDPGSETWSWSTPGFTMMDGATPVAQIGGTSLNVSSTATITLIFAAQAFGSTTTFTFTSTQLGLSLNPAEAGAAGGITLTDEDSTSGTGGTLVGAHGDGNSFQAMYNGSNVLLSGLPGLTVGPRGSASDSTSTGGFLPTPPLSDISLQFKFDLSAEEGASGTAFMAAQVPEPAGLVLVAFGFVAAVRRRGA